MTKRRTVLLAFGACLLACAFGAGYQMIVLAQGAPTKQPLFYSGVLEVDGAAANGEYKVKLALYDAATGGHSLCGVEADADADEGHFRIDASDCAGALADEPDAWVAISFVDPKGNEHKIQQRSKIGAAPYALEAQHAVSASEPVGALADTIDGLNGRIKALEEGSAQTSAFIALKTQSQPNDGNGVVLFDEQQVDVGETYDPAEGKFTAPADGLYEFSCTIAWDIGSSAPGTWEVALALNGFEYTYNGSIADGQGLTRSITSVIALEEGDGVTCTALSSVASTTLNVSGSHAYNVFAGHRIR